MRGYDYPSDTDEELVFRAPRTLCGACGHEHPWRQVWNTLADPFESNGKVVVTCPECNTKTVFKARYIIHSVQGEKV